MVFIIPSLPFILLHFNTLWSNTTDKFDTDTMLQMKGFVGIHGKTGGDIIPHKSKPGFIINESCQNKSWNETMEFSLFI